MATPSGRTRHLGYVLKRFPRISETFVAAEVLELERQGERVTIFAVSQPEEPFRHAFLAGLRAPVVYLPHRIRSEPIRIMRALARLNRTDLPGWLFAAASSLWPPRLVGLRDLLQATVLRDELQRAGVTHVHAHFASTAARLAMLSFRMGGPTYSVTAHAKDIYHEAIRIEHIRENLAPATFVTTVSESNRTYLEEVLDGRARVHLIPNAVDLRRIDVPPERRPDPGLVLTVARLVEKKGLGDLIVACGMLARDGLLLRLDVVGEGELRNALETEAQRWPMPVTFHGAMPHERVMELYPRAAVFSLPCVVAANGDRDGLPTSVLEAMAMRVPVVTTAVNGLREIVIDGDTGIVVPERQPEALAAALRRVLLDPSLAERLGRSARRTVETKLSLERSVGELRSLFPAAA